MTIELCHNNLTDFDLIMESFCLCKARLTNTSIHHENRTVWLHLILNLNHLIEKGLLLFMSSGCIHDNDFILLLFEEINTCFSDLYWILFVLVTEEGYANLGGVHF